VCTLSRENRTVLEYRPSGPHQPEQDTDTKSETNVMTLALTEQEVREAIETNDCAAIMERLTQQVMDRAFD